MSKIQGIEMPQVTPLGALRASFTDKCGRLLAGGKIYTYEENSLTPKITYTDFTGVVPNTNPIVLDRSGEADIFLDGSYRFQIFDRFGTLIHDINNVRDHFKDQIKSYFVENILAAGGLPENSAADYDYLMQRLAQIAVDKGWDASFVTTASSQNQQQINDFGGAKWWNKPLGYDVGSTVKLENGDIVKSTIPNNINDPNVDMTGWLNQYLQLTQNTMYSNYDIVEAELLKIYIERKPISAVLKTDGTDETVKLKAYIAKAKSLARPLELPSGIITFTDTLLIDFTAIMRGAGKDKTVLQPKNTVTNKAAILLVRGSAKSNFSDFVLRDENFGTSSLVVMTDKRTGVGSAVWKNNFTNVGFSGSARAVTFTSDNPLDGSTHAHCDDNYFASCSFTNNKVDIFNQNTQAVINLFIGCEFEKSDGTWIKGEPVVDDNFSIIEDYAGVGITLNNCSLIGRGRWYNYQYPVGGTGLFAGSAQISILNSRAELRPTHCGVLIEEKIGGIGNPSVQISVADTTTVNQGANIDLLRFGSSIKASFNNVEVALGTGKLFIRQYPTLGRTANNTIGSLANVSADNCSDLFYEKETTSPYGTYNNNATANVTITQSKTCSPNQAYSTDVDGWNFLRASGDIQQLPFTLGTMSTPARLVWNRDAVDNNLAVGTLLKIGLPKYGRPTKLFCYKHPFRQTSDQSFKLYLVKDKAAWATTVFNKTTDAVLVATSPATLNKSGYFEVNIEMLSASLGSAIQSGTTGWLEGRMLIEYVGSAMYAGFVGIEYI